MNRIICFHDNNKAAQILETDDAAHIKDLGRRVSGYDENLWNGVRQLIVYEGLCAVKDRIWGIRLSMKDPDRFDRTRWKGQNLLGYALMMARERIYR